MTVTVSITNGRKDNVKTTTPLKDRHIKKVLEGRMAPSEEEVIKKLKKERCKNEARKEPYAPAETFDGKVASESR